MKKYDKKTLKRLQNTELEMLKDLNYICEKYNIDYFATGGTGIGAVRHKGMIPWDDDIDLNFLEKDLKKFIKYSKIEFKSKYFFINYNNNEKACFMFTKWCKTGTSFIDYTAKEIGLNPGIFIDLYPMYYISDNYKKSIINKSWFYSKLGILVLVKNPIINYKGIKRKVITIGCNIIHYFLIINNITSKRLFDKAKKKLNIQTQKTNTIIFPFETSPMNMLYLVNDIFPTQKFKFNDSYVLMPKNYNKVLTQMFGDYKKLPPEEKRYNHCPYILDFGEINTKDND
jgi:lipopolysaccharide cholinephosphotransferase